MSIVNLTDIQTVIGSGFKRNYFSVVFQFIDKDLGSKSKPKSAFLNKIVQIIKQDQNYEIPRSSATLFKKGNFKKGDGLKKNIGSAFNNDIVSKYLHSGNNWNSLVKGFQLPGLEASETPETIKDRTSISEVTNGIITVNILNDRYGASHDFWRIYLKLLSGNQILYPSQYKFDLKFSTVLEFKRSRFKMKRTLIKTFTFHNCYVQNSPDLDYDMGNKSAHDFTIPIKFENYTDKVQEISKDELLNEQLVSQTISLAASGLFGSLVGNIGKGLF